MFHSCYVAARLGIWTEGGKKKLQMFLAKMGLPVEEAMQRYSCLRHASGLSVPSLKCQRLRSLPFVQLF